MYIPAINSASPLRGGGDPVYTVCMSRRTAKVSQYELTNIYDFFVRTNKMLNLFMQEETVFLGSFIQTV